MHLDVLILRDALASSTLVVHKMLMQKLESILVGTKIIKRSDFTRACVLKKKMFPARNGEGMREADGEQVTNEETTAGTAEARPPTLGPI